MRTQYLLLYICIYQVYVQRYLEETFEAATAIDNREKLNLPVPGRCAHRHRYAVTTTTPQPPLYRKSHKVSYPTETTTHEGRVLLSPLKTPEAVAIDAQWQCRLKRRRQPRQQQNALLTPSYAASDGGKGFCLITSFVLYTQTSGGPIRKSRGPLYTKPARRRRDLNPECHDLDIIYKSPVRLPVYRQNGFKETVQVHSRRSSIRISCKKNRLLNLFVHSFHSIFRGINFPTTP